VYTLLGGCEEWWRADVARNYYTNREQIFETRAFKDIGTVRNTMKRVVVCFVCFKMRVKVQSYLVRSHVQCISVGKSVSGCMYAGHDDHDDKY
jgi:hypothetical protein